MSRETYEDLLWRARLKRKVRRMVLLAVAGVVLVEMYGVPHVKISERPPPYREAEYWSPIGSRSVLGGRERLMIVRLFPLETSLRTQAAAWARSLSAKITEEVS